MRRFTQPIQTDSIGNGAIVADKLAAALANNVGANQTGVTNRVVMTPMTTERLKTGVGWSDVPSGSTTFSVTAGTYLLIGFSADVKCPSASTVYYRVLANTAIAGTCYQANAYGPTVLNYSFLTTSTSYVTHSAAAILPAASVGTGTQTFKWQFSGDGTTHVAYINNAYLSITQVTF